MPEPRINQNVATANVNADEIMTPQEAIQVMKEVIKTLTDSGVRVELQITIGAETEPEEAEESLTISDLGTQLATPGETDLYLGFNGGPAGSVFWGDEEDKRGKKR